MCAGAISQCYAYIYTDQMDSITLPAATKQKVEYTISMCAHSVFCIHSMYA